MRNPKRIGVILHLLDRYWRRYPDWRFFQLVCALQTELDAEWEHPQTPFFNLEDDELIKGLLYLLGEERIPESTQKVLEHYETRDDDRSSVESVERCRYRLEMEPNDASLWRRLGWMHYDRHDFEEAVVCLRKAITLDPGDACAYFWLGCSYESQLLYTDAWKMFSRAAELDPENEEYREWRDRMLAKLQ